MDPGSERKSSLRSIWKRNWSDRHVQTADDGQTCGASKDDENSLKSGRTDASLRPSTNSTSTEPPYGLFILHDQPNDRSNAVDIVAVHGLNGHYEKTWQETGPDGQPVNWLRDFLPSQIPYARIMSYGYNSTVFFSKSEADFGTFAEQLLEDILSRRRRDMVRPMIFICHSLGGIVFKKALIRGNERTRYEPLLKSIRGVAFFGTPHRGSELAYWSTMFSNIVKTASLGRHTQVQLSKDLEVRSKALKEIAKGFVERGKDLVIFSFYETDKMDFLNCRVVNEESAILDMPNETPIAINGNHRTICRFAENGQRYRKVWTNLQDMALEMITRTLSPQEKACHRSLYISDYQNHRDRNPAPVPGTCEWLIHHEQYQAWYQTSNSSLLWLSADAGCGKSVLTSFLTEHLSSIENRIKVPDSVCYFFFKADNAQQNNPVNAMAALLYQLYINQPALLSYAYEQYQQKESNIASEFSTMWRIFLDSIRDKDATTVIILLDGLDECEKSTRQQLLHSLSAFYSDRKGPKKRAATACVKTIIASRPENDIKMAFARMPIVRLRGEDETEAISRDVELVVQASIQELVSQGLPSTLLLELQDIIIRRADRTFLWTTMVIELLKDAAERGASKRDMTMILESRDIDDIYRQLLTSSVNWVEARKLLQLVLAAKRPLTLDEINVALAVHAESHIDNFESLTLELKHPIENYLKSLCGHFVRIIRNRIYLVHQTAREFLMRSSYGTTTSDPKVLHTPLYESISLTQSHILMLCTCVRYLRLFAVPESERVRFMFRGGAEREATEVGTFLEYAARYWPTHFDESGDAPKDLWRECGLICNPNAPGFAIWFGSYCFHWFSLKYNQRLPQLDYITDPSSKDGLMKEFLTKPSASTVAEFVGLLLLAGYIQEMEYDPWPAEMDVFSMDIDDDTRSKNRRIRAENQEFYSGGAFNEDLDDLLDDLDPPFSKDEEVLLHHEGGNLRTQVMNRAYIERTKGQKFSVESPDGKMLIPEPRRDQNALVQPHTVSKFVRQERRKIFLIDRSVDVFSRVTRGSS